MVKIPEVPVSGIASTSQWLPIHCLVRPRPKALLVCWCWTTC